MRVLVLGAGFGGLELTSSLAEKFGGDIEITLIDKNDGFVFGFSKLDVMFGRASGDAVRHRYADIVKPGVTFVQAEITGIDAEARRAETTAGSFEADFMVIALGADFDIDATPGLADEHEFYTVAGAFDLQPVIDNFAGGRVLIGVLGTPYKCPPAPSEAALLMHDHLAQKGLLEQSQISLAIDFPRPIPPSPDASDALLTAFGERGIEWLPRTEVERLDTGRKVAITRAGDELRYDLFLGVPIHVAPRVLRDSGICVDGWVPVDPLTLETPHPGVYAVGDVAAVGTPRAGVFAEGQAKVAAEQIAAKIKSATSDAAYDGHGVCYLEFGDGTIGKVDVTFFGDSKEGKLIGPSADFVADKAEFGATRIKRWFGRDWTNPAA
ncbi:MAG: FAD/NAD(P)-binding oxidoreductase [Solirubrobacterales bacterium]